MKILQHFYFLLFLSCIFPFNADAQTGEIQGKVTDAETGEILPFANISIEVNGNLVGTTTDFDGIYSITSIPVGVYDLTFSYVGFQTKRIQKVPVNVDKTTFLNIQLVPLSKSMNPIDTIEYYTPLMEADQDSIGLVMAEDIQSMPVREIKSGCGFQADSELTKKANKKQIRKLRRKERKQNKRSVNQ